MERTAHKTNDLTKLIISAAFILVYLFHAGYSHAAEKITLLLSADRKPYTIISDDIIRQLPATTIESLVLPTDVSGHFKTPIRNSNLIIPLGSKACSYAHHNFPKNNVYCALVTKNLTDNLQHHAIKKHSSLYINQPLSRYITLAKSLHRKTEKIGYMVAANNKSLISLIKSHDKSTGTKSVVITVNDKKEVLRKLKSLIREADVLIALPDRRVYNRSTIKGVLLTTYRKKIPLIGFSNSYTKAGAVASLFTTPKQFSQQLIEEIKKWKHSKQLPQPSHPKYFDITVNKSVARTLSIALPNTTDIKQRINEQESTTLKGESE